MKRLLFLIFILCFQTAAAQVSQDDLLLIEDSGNLDHHDHIEKEERSFLSKINPARLLANAALTVYQKGFSPQLGTRCNYELSCSHFSRASLKEFGIVKGVFLSADRILRCNRISYSGIEPVKINLETGKVLDFPIDYRVK